MRINEGNIFEAMRLVLPEHRSAMKDGSDNAVKASSQLFRRTRWSRCIMFYPGPLKPDPEFV